MSLREGLINALLFFPTRGLDSTPAALGLEHQEITLRTADGERLHGFWIPTPVAPRRGHVLLCHGNAGNVGGRLTYARMLGRLGLDVLLFDYRGFGLSSGRPSEQGTAHDARAALDALLRQPGVDPQRVLYLGESLGGAVAIALAEERPPRGLILQSTFTSVREIGRHHYPFVPSALVPDAYPSAERLARITVPTLLVSGDHDLVVPVEHSRALHAAAAGPKRLEILDGIGHNDLLDRAADRYAAIIATWLDSLDDPRESSPPATNPRAKNL